MDHTFRLDGGRSETPVVNSIVDAENEPFRKAERDRVGRHAVERS
jgi:hypothetical protein